MEFELVLQGRQDLVPYLEVVGWLMVRDWEMEDEVSVRGCLTGEMMSLTEVCSGVSVTVMGTGALECSVQLCFPPYSTGGEDSEFLGWSLLDGCLGDSERG